MADDVSASMTAEDERRIAALLVRYATAIDRRDWKLLRSCFTDDFKGDYGDFGRWASGDEIVAGMVELHKPFGPSLHRLSNIAIEPAPDGARARTYVDVVLIPLDSGDPVRQALGYYDDDLVAAADGWKIRTRRFTLVRLL
jgi:hypothetical protein